MAKLIKIDWDIFKVNSHGNPHRQFEWLCYLLFCEEFNKPLGITGYKNQAHIETDPIKVGEEIIGWQAKFYDTPLSQHKPEIIELIEGAKERYPTIDKIIFYTNQNWSQGKKHNDPQAKIEIDTKAKELGIEVDWDHMENFFQSPDVCQEYAEIIKSFFTLNQDNINSPFLISIVNKEINENVNLLRKFRFFQEFDTVNKALSLAQNIIDIRGDYNMGGDLEKKRALAWCVRCLSFTDKLSQAKEYLNVAKGLGNCTEITIADAFISSAEGDKKKALSTLADINSSISKSASLMIVERHEGKEEAISWLHKAGINAEELDSDGKCFLLGRLLMLARWDDAYELLKIVSDQDQKETPAFFSLMAITYLLSTVPDEFRSTILKTIPIDMRCIPLQPTPGALYNRRKAKDYFIAGRNIAQEYECNKTAREADKYALWLELVDPDYSEQGKKRLEKELCKPIPAFDLVHFGFQFKVNLDVVAIEQAIEKEIARRGGYREDTALARLAIASFAQKSVEDVANYIDQYYDLLAEHINTKLLKALQVEMFARAGLTAKAKACLESLSQERLPSDQKKRLQIIIDTSQGVDPIGDLEALFKQTDKLEDLEILVRRLEEGKKWGLLCKYGKTLFARAGSIENAERWAKALFQSHKTEQLIQFIQDHDSLLPQSKSLRLFYVWALYYEGYLLDARSELEKIEDDWETPNRRNLEVNLGISLGDWDSLHVVIEREYQQKDKRNAQELLGVAQLAIYLENPHVKELLQEAINKDKDNAEILSASYFLAAQAGLENEPAVTQWLHKAVKCSGSDGPLQKMSLENLSEQKSQWDRKESEIWQLLSRGEIPMFLAAHSLNKSLIEFMSFPALFNSSGSDPRHRISIPAYSGNEKRQPVPLTIDKTIGLDATVLLTLGYLDLLDKVLDAFDSIYIPHSMLAWLFEEKKRAKFHQPSRIDNANQIRDLLIDGILEEEEFVSSAKADGDLSEQIGDELAMFIAEAENEHNDNVQRLVVQPFPVFRVSSFMDQEVDLTKHSTVMSGCWPIVEKLPGKAFITTQEKEKARSYLQLHEKPWPNQPGISDKAILYLDSLAVRYFLYLGMLKKLKQAGFKLVVSSRTLDEYKHLITYKGLSGQVKEIIEKIRVTLNSRIIDDRIKVGRKSNANNLEQQEISIHPTADVLALAKGCDAIISDDRYLNQYLNAGEGDGQVPIFTTLDILDTLVKIDSITPNGRQEYKTRLRLAGYFFVPIERDELRTHLTASEIEGKKIEETIALKVIRESILQIRMQGLFQFPKENYWLHTTFMTFIQVLQDLWKDNSKSANLEGVIVRSNWLVDQIDICGWEHSFKKEKRNDIKAWQGKYILRLCSLPLDVSQEMKKQYWDWVENKVVKPIKEGSPDLYTWLVEQKI